MALPNTRQPALWLRATLWALTVIFMLGAAAYQRLTGPTHPLRGTYSVLGTRYPYRLIRSDWSHKTRVGATVQIPAPGEEVSGKLYFRRYPGSDTFQIGDLYPLLEGGTLFLRGELPAQPAAGKLEYFIRLDTAEGVVRIPEAENGNVIIRFKDHVPATVLVPHIVFMFLAVLVGMRAGLSAAFTPFDMRRWAWTTLVLMSLGGMLLGPLVQKYAFGAYWTGWPLGGDWTDNKMLAMWLSWVVACAVIGFRPRRGETRSRIMVVLAALVMTGVYLIPHSMGGSELDYSQVERGVDPAKAIRTGRHE